jgi:hypothetical protein
MSIFEEIKLGSTFDAKGFKQAETAVGKLNSNVKKLAGTFGIAFGATALVQFSKTAVKAFAADEAAALRLNRAVENLGIGFANPAIADYIDKLEMSAGVAKDILRPAIQGLLTTTGSLTQSQKLLNDAITISRASGIDLATVTEDLGKGYIGITKGLTKYNTGLTKSELQTKSFNEILGVILARSAGAAEDYLTTTSYKMDVLSIATGRASDLIGKGFVDALARASGGTEASDAAIFLETMAGLFNKLTLAAGTSVGAIPTLAQNLKKLGKDIFFGFVGKQVGANVVSPAKKEEAKLTLTEKKQQELLAKMEKEALRREKERLALLNKQNTAKKLQGVIDKANLTLGKATDVFDLDKIQLNAAMINQAQQLGQVTSQAQLLTITNDIARLRIKQDILALEDAIASKDEAAITAATLKLNKDLLILGALQNQSLKLADIKSILETLLPKDLINLANLNEAIRLLTIINNGKTPSATNPVVPVSPLTPKTPNPLIPVVPVAPAGVGAGTKTDAQKWAEEIAAKAAADAAAAAQVSLTNQVAQASFTEGITAGLSTAAALSGARYAAQGAAMMGGGTVNVTIQAGVGDPNAIAEALDQYLQGAVDRGTLRIR